MFSNIKGIIYDFDGTIVDSNLLHETAWACSARELGIRLEPEFFIEQAGLDDTDAAKFALQEDYSKLGPDFVKKKKEYALSKICDELIFPDFLETKELLKKKGYDVSICTSTNYEFMSNFLQCLQLKDLQNNLVTRNSVDFGKPNPDMLLKTFSLINLKPEQCVYVGNTYGDYLFASNAQTNFVYYQQAECIKELRDYQYKITKHNQIFNFLKYN